MYSIKNIIVAIFIITIYINAKASNMAGAANSYANVWGYDISDYPAVKSGLSVIDAFHSPEGDLVFIFHSEQLQKHTLKYKDKAINFFAGTIVDVEDKYDFIAANNLKEIKSGGYIRPLLILKDNLIIASYGYNTGKLCQYNDLLSQVFIKARKNFGPFDDDNQTMSIIGALPEVWRYQEREDGYCERGGPSGGQLIYKQLYAFTNIIPLKDETFIAFSTNGNLIIRFDKNFKTKFKAQHDTYLWVNPDGEKIKGNFFVLPYSKIQELDMQVMKDDDHGVQGLHDKLLLYLYKRQTQSLSTGKVFTDCVRTYRGGSRKNQGFFAAFLEHFP